MRGNSDRRSSGTRRGRTTSERGRSRVRRSRDRTVGGSRTKKKGANAQEEGAIERQISGRREIKIAGKKMEQLLITCVTRERDSTTTEI